MVSIAFCFSSAQNATVQGLPENIVKGLPRECVDEQSQLLQNSEQCRLCLRGYQIGQHVRRLPCRHQFHKDCIGKIIGISFSSSSSFIF